MLYQTILGAGLGFEKFFGVYLYRLATFFLSKYCPFLVLSCSLSLCWVVVFGDYCVSPNFLVVLGLVLWLRLGLGCDN